MATILSFFISLLVVVPLSSYLILRSVFSGNDVPAEPSQYLRPGDHLQQSLLTHQGHFPSPALPLHTSGRHIVDMNGTRVKLFSVNWYGASDGGFVPGGLDVRHRDDIAMTIKKLGFNSVRLPYADELVYNDPTVNATLLSSNPDLVGQTALKVFAAVVKAMTDVGLFVIINNHITKARWCCDANVCDGLWKNDHWGPLCRVRQTEESWIRNLETVMLPHISNPLVIGVDLRNEVRGMTDRLLWNSWAAAAEHAATRLHALQPEWLIVVEGVSSANDISGATQRPVKLGVPNKLVYSAHVYGWSGWGSLIPFWKRPYDSFAAEMQRKWGYLLEQDIAPVWVGELGAPNEPSQGDLHYWNNLMRYLGDIDADFAYWAINPRKWDRNEKETYSLVHDDWKTPVTDYRMYDMHIPVDFSDMLIMFSTALYKKPIWPHVQSNLGKDVQWSLKESSRVDFDLAFPIHKTNATLYIVLISVSESESGEMDQPYSLIRDSSLPDRKLIVLVDRVFQSEDRTTGMAILSKLQVRHVLDQATVPFIYVASADQIARHTDAYLESLQSDIKLDPHPAVDALHVIASATTTVPYQYLTNQEARAVSKVCPSIRALEESIRTEDGQLRLREFLDERTVQGMVQFWEDEWIV